MKNNGKVLTLLGIGLVLIVVMIVRGCQIAADGPSARYGAKMIYDPQDNQLFMFGGRAQSLFGLKYFNDLWTFDPANQSWSQIRTPARPPARLSPGMAYDPINHQIILFGGHDEQGRLADTWIYHITENRWQELSPTISPSPRSDMGMVYDDNNQMVILFSGYCQEGGRDMCDDTWRYDPELMTWTEMNPATAPPITYGHTLAYDSYSGQPILWGGHMSSGGFKSIGYSDSTWHYDYLANSWYESASSPANKPAARYWHQLSFASKSDELFLFGGDGGHGFLADTWLLDVESNSWKKVNSELAPSARINAAVVYDPLNEQVVIFGGREEDRDDLQDTWLFKMTADGGEWHNLN